ncbi:MAG TPA: hypothetical protein VNS32_15095, partial [Flavisolibacter sp.]|nr:hypothetical protein [Flavisolibacter sp.]
NPAGHGGQMLPEGFRTIKPFSSPIVNRAITSLLLLVSDACFNSCSIRTNSSNFKDISSYNAYDFLNCSTHQISDFQTRKDLAFHRSFLKVMDQSWRQKRKQHTTISFNTCPLP